MSVVFVGVTPEGIVMAGDGVSYDTETGCVAQYVSKLHLFPHLNCALGFTGLGSAGVAYAALIDGAYRNFDELLAGAVDELRRVHLALTLERRLFKNEHDTKMSVALAGWSDERQRFEAYRITSYQKEAYSGGHPTPGFPAWTLSPIAFVWASMLPDDDHCERLGVDLKSCADLGELAIRFVCAARASSGTMDGGDGLHFNVGGFVQVACINDQGIQSWIAHRWPEDEIGSPINPRIGQELPEWLGSEAAG